MGIMCVKYLAQSMAQTSGPPHVSYYYHCCHQHPLGMVLACIPRARKSAWEPTALRSRRHRAHEGQTGLGGVLARPGPTVNLQGPLGSCPAVVVAVWEETSGFPNSSLGAWELAQDVLTLTWWVPAPTERCKSEEAGMCIMALS